MMILGLQKLTLLDYPGKIACIIFCGGCNFRCPFCHNAALVTGGTGTVNIGEDEINEYLKLRRGLFEGVVITGGEPLLQPDLERFIRQVKEMGYLVKLDTNGYMPEKLETLINSGLLDYVAMDIKNSLPKYSQTAGVRVNTENIEKSVGILLQNKTDYEFRTTVVNELHDENDFTQIGELIKDARLYALQCFNDSGGLIRKGGYFTPPKKSDLTRFESIIKPYVKKTVIRGI